MPISDTRAHVRIACACHTDKHSSNIDHAIKQLNNTSTSALQGKCVIFAMLCVLRQVCVCVCVFVFVFIALLREPVESCLVQISLMN